MCCVVLQCNGKRREGLAKCCNFFSLLTSRKAQLSISGCSDRSETCGNDLYPVEANVYCDNRLELDSTRWMFKTDSGITGVVVLSAKAGSMGPISRNHLRDHPCWIAFGDKCMDIPLSHHTHATLRTRPLPSFALPPTGT